MSAILKKLLPIAKSPPKKDDDDRDDGDSSKSFRLEYSIALEYTGPLLNHDAIPRAVPVDFDQITTALTVSSSSVFNKLSIPVIHPISHANGTKPKNLPEEFDSRSKRFSTAGSPVASVVSSHDSKIVAKATSSSQSSSPASRKTHDSVASSIATEYQCDPREVESLEFLSADHSVNEGLNQDKNTLQLFEENDYDTNSKGVESIKSEAKSVAQSIPSAIETTPNHARRPSVTFASPDESECSDSLDNEVIPRAERKGKKGTCYRCMKGNRFMDKEVCIVCGAKYCFNCVLRAMGSMPEGRKCITCIGKKINEAKRSSLGKCSRLLRRLLSDFEIMQIMDAEVFCEANRFPSHQIYVNGTSLSQEALFVLQKCPCPPKRLKPGRYWYDKVAGFWGKEGHRPSQIISPELNVGGSIQKEASNGDTKISINGRVITKFEVLLLQLAGVRYENETSFWVSADGSCREEGQNIVRGWLWKKKRAKLACALLSSPTPSDPEKTQPTQPQVPNFLQKNLLKLLLVGSESSGTSTVYKQARLLYDRPFDKDERLIAKLMMQKCCLYRYLDILLEKRKQCEENLPEKITESFDNPEANFTREGSRSARAEDLCDKILEAMASGNLDVTLGGSRRHVPADPELHNDSALQALYDSWKEIQALPEATPALEILQSDYEPSDWDILCAKGIPLSTGLSSFEFSFPNSQYDSSLEEYQHDPSLRYQLIRAHPRNLGGNCRWLEMFEEIEMVIFCASLTDYDQVEEKENGTPINKMMLTKKLFETIVTHPTLKEKKFLLILNKFDLLEEKISRVPLTTCEWFSDFNPVMSQSPHSENSRRGSAMSQRAFHYIAAKFKRLFDAVTDERTDRGRNFRRKLFVTRANALEADTVDMAMRYARSILQWQVEESSMVQVSITSIEGSSF